MPLWLAWVTNQPTDQPTHPGPPTPHLNCRHLVNAAITNASITHAAFPRCSLGNEECAFDLESSKPEMVLGVDMMPMLGVDRLVDIYSLQHVDILKASCAALPCRPAPSQAASTPAHAYKSPARGAAGFSCLRLYVAAGIVWVAGLPGRRVHLARPRQTTREIPLAAHPGLPLTLFLAAD